MSKTITISVYEADELHDKHPEGYKRAHDEFREAMWASWGNELVGDDMRMIADIMGHEGAAVFGDRFLGWDLYRKDIAYDDGFLGHSELQRLAAVLDDDRVTADSMRLAFRHGVIVQHPDYSYAEAPEDMMFRVSEYLGVLYRRMLAQAEASERQLESDDYFIEHAEANGYLFDASGRMM